MLNEKTLIIQLNVRLISQIYCGYILSFENK